MKLSNNLEIIMIFCHFSTRSGFNPFLTLDSVKIKDYFCLKIYSVKCVNEAGSEMILLEITILCHLVRVNGSCVRKYSLFLLLNYFTQM